jgi:DNA (cytosine-5)-methyltransferase 1
MHSFDLNTFYQSILTPSKPEKPLRVLDVFCGAGGFSMGFVAMGHRAVAGVEIDTHAAQTYRHNIAYFQKEPVTVYGGPVDGDMRTLSPERVLDEVGEVDVMVGGPPCKAFSRIGRGKLNSLTDGGYLADPRNELYNNFHHFLEVFAPRAFLMENVTGMLSMNGENVADRAARELSRPMGTRGLTYEVRYAVLDASWYGVPQYRHRVIFMGIRSDQGILPSFPARLTTGSPAESGYLQWRDAHDQLELFGGQLRKSFTAPVPAASPLASPISVSDALDDLPTLTEHLGEEGVTPKSDWRETVAPEKTATDASAYAQLMQAWDAHGGSRAGGINAHFIRMTRRDFETFREMDHGDSYPEAATIALRRFEERIEQLVNDGVELTDELAQRLRQEIIPPYPNDGNFKDRWQKLVPDRPSWTVTAHLSRDTYSHIHHESEQARAVSVREAARLQSFPDRFWFGPDGGMREAFAQIGNAVPPLMAAALAKHLSYILPDQEEG